MGTGVSRIWLTMAPAVLGGAAASATSGDAVQAAEGASERELRQLNKAAAEMQVRKDADAAEAHRRSEDATRRQPTPRWYEPTSSLSGSRDCREPPSPTQAERA